MTYSMDIPEHGEIRQSTNFPPHIKRNNQITIVTWNIQYGKELKGIIAYLSSLDADILLLQEADWGNIRTEKKNITKEIANALQYNYIFSPDLEQLYSWKRNFYKKAGQGGGVSGNAILSRLPLSNPFILELPYTDMYNGIIPTRSTIRNFFAPTKGKCIALGASVETGKGIIPVYTTHLEISRATIATRVAQFKSINNNIGNANRVILAGDFNTAAHGIFGLYNIIENYDAWTKKSIFTPEAVYWKKHIIKETNLTDPFNPGTDWTLQVKGLYHAKLDWILTRGLTVIKHEVGSVGYSDHRPLVITVEI